MKTLPFVQPPTPRLDRTLGDKLQEIAGRSPKDLGAIEVLVDMVLERLDDKDRRDAEKAHRDSWGGK